MAYYGEKKIIHGFFNGQKVTFIYVGEKAEATSEETELNEEEQ